MVLTKSSRFDTAREKIKAEGVREDSLGASCTRKEVIGWRTEQDCSGSGMAGATLPRTFVGGAGLRRPLASGLGADNFGAKDMGSSVPRARFASATLGNMRTTGVMFFCGLGGTFRILTVPLLGRLA